jgi:hypothetical protein
MTAPTPTTPPLDHLIMKEGFYYRPNKSGYTKEVSAAGRYTKADAEREARIEPWHMSAVPVTSVPELSRIETMAQTLRMIAEGQSDPRRLARAALEATGHDR